MTTTQYTVWANNSGGTVSATLNISQRSENTTARQQQTTPPLPRLSLHRLDPEKS